MSTTKARSIDPEHIFAASRAQFDGLIAQLQGGDTLSMTHSEVENLLWSNGMDLLRQLLQDHLDLRALREQRKEAIEGIDGVRRTHHRLSARQLESLFGNVGVGRIEYSGRGIPSLHPLDAELNLPDGLYSHGVCRRVAEEAARGAYV